MPLVGFGIWKVPAENAADSVYNAIKIGYRHIDGAHDYQNSAQAGEGVRKAIKDGLVKREELFITSKLWNNYHAKPHVLEMAEYENKNWGVDYLDLVSSNKKITYHCVHFVCLRDLVTPRRSHLRLPDRVSPSMDTRRTREAVRRLETVSLGGGDRTRGLETS